MEDPPSRFNLLAERLAAVRRSQQRPTDSPDEDSDDDAPLGDPRFDPRANAPRRYTPPSRDAREVAPDETDGDEIDPAGSASQDDGAFVIRPRISAKQASELAFSDARPSRLGKLPLLSPAQP